MWILVESEVNWCDCEGRRTWLPGADSAEEISCTTNKTGGCSSWFSEVQVEKVSEVFVGAKNDQ